MLHHALASIHNTFKMPLPAESDMLAKSELQMFRAIALARLICKAHSWLLSTAAIDTSGRQKRTVDLRLEPP